MVHPGELAVREDDGADDGGDDDEQHDDPAHDGARITTAVVTRGRYTVKPASS